MWSQSGPLQPSCASTPSTCVVGWATKALDEVRRAEWNRLRRTGTASAATKFKGLRFLLRRNKLARTIRRYRPSIEATIEWKLTNGIAKSNNASIARIRANARGFHDPQAFIP